MATALAVLCLSGARSFAEQKWKMAYTFQLEDRSSVAFARQNDGITLTFNYQRYPDKTIVNYFQDSIVVYDFYLPDTTRIAVIDIRDVSKEALPTNPSQQVYPVTITQTPAAASAPSAAVPVPAQTYPLILSYESEIPTGTTIVFGETIRIVDNYPTHQSSVAVFNQSRPGSDLTAEKR